MDENCGAAWRRRRTLVRGEPAEVYGAGSERDGLESWMLAAPDARPLSQAALRDVVSDDLASHAPFPDSVSFEVVRRDGSAWETAVIIERPGTDEWTVEYEDGTQA
ncbi:tudor domain-containing protein [Arthrobacter sp. KN11-1C]|uniref:tudor domain-containing protein n=1 Tax=Arthrobacter sp. KN11-1C TaxID=3445774 RepID=UPI003FA123A1